jgi:hypothetical protein
MVIKALEDQGEYGKAWSSAKAGSLEGAQKPSIHKKKQGEFAGRTSASYTGSRFIKYSQKT